MESGEASRSAERRTAGSAEPLDYSIPDPAPVPHSPQAVPENPFGDERAQSVASPSGSIMNPFQSPAISRPASSFGGSSSALGRPLEAGGSESGSGSSGGPQRYFHSRRIQKGEVEKPWLEKKDPREKWVTILPLIGILIGLGISGFLVWDGIHSVVQHNYCVVLDDSFATLNTEVWTKEVQVGGYG